LLHLLSICSFVYTHTHTLSEIYTFLLKYQIMFFIFKKYQNGSLMPCNPFKQWSIVSSRFHKSTRSNKMDKINKMYPRSNKMVKFQFENYRAIIFSFLPYLPQNSQIVANEPWNNNLMSRFWHTPVS